MKAEQIELAQQRVAAAREALVEAIRSLIEAQALPDDPVPLLPAPADLRITDSYGDNTLTIGLGVENVSGLILEYQGDSSDPHGPQTWQSIPVNAMEDSLGTRATLSLTPSASRLIVVRAYADGRESAALVITTNPEGKII